MEENYIRRERKRKAHTKKVVNEMRSALPVYDLDQIRQYKLAFHEALLTNLTEKGLVCSAEFLKQLLAFQANLRETAGPQSVIWVRPQLVNSKNELVILTDGLVKSEEFHNAGLYTKQCEAFLKLAVYFAFLHENWWWLGEQLLIQAVSVSTEYSFLGGKHQALSRYAYAKFLVTNSNDHVAAMDHLNIVLQLSIGVKWTTKHIFPEEKDILYTQTNHLLYVCLLHQATQLIKVLDYEGASKLAILARKRAAEACCPDGETKSLVLNGICQMSMQDAKAAISCFCKAYFIQEKMGCEEGVCEARIQLAKAYLLCGNSFLSLKTLLVVKDTAVKFNLLFYLAQSYWHLGEFYLNNGEPQKASPLLAEALSMFNDGQNIKESEQVRILGAISSGLELFSSYLVLLSRTDKPHIGVQSMQKLIDWKDSRTPFWEESSVHSIGIEDVIKESVSLVSTNKDAENIMIEEKRLVDEKTKQVDDEEEEEIVALHVNIDNFQESVTGLQNAEQ